MWNFNRVESHIKQPKYSTISLVKIRNFAVNPYDFGQFMMKGPAFDTAFTPKVDSLWELATDTLWVFYFVAIVFYPGTTLMGSFEILYVYSQDLIWKVCLLL